VTGNSFVYSCCHSWMARLPAGSPLPILPHNVPEPYGFSETRRVCLRRPRIARGLIRVFVLPFVDGPPARCTFCPDVV
jgi:hypothetical protein